MKKIKIEDCCTHSEYRDLLGHIQMLDYCVICGKHISTRTCNEDGIPVSIYIWKVGQYHECEECE